MRPQENKAGIRLWQMAAEYKEYRADLTDKMAFKMALLSNPDLAESYLGHPVRRDGHAEVIRILYSPMPLTGTKYKMKSVQIKCSAAVNIPLADLTPLQGELKQLSDANFGKLKKSILKHGITFPFFVWQNEGKNYILDGTQRDRVLTRMSEDGFDIPALPSALIQAKDRKEAAEQILLISSQYGKMSNNSLQNFLAENDLAYLELDDELDLPNIDSDFFRDADFEPTSTDEQGRLDKKNPVRCPECGHEFIP